MIHSQPQRILMGIGLVLLGLGLAYAADPAPKPAETRLSLSAARERTALLHDVYSATLDVVHERYFHGDRAVIPARALEDVFKEIERKNQTQARWISASFAPMSINHEPKTEFEKQAARRIAKGEAFVETIEDGYYRRAGQITLSGGCVSCHGGLFAVNSPTAKFAGLILSVPIDLTARLPKEAQNPAP